MAIRADSTSTSKWDDAAFILRDRHEEGWSFSLLQPVQMTMVHDGSQIPGVPLADL